MKNTIPKATRTVYPIICQIVNTVPVQFIAETAKEHKVLSRTFSPKSHVAAMLYCQVSKTESLNSICDVARANDALWRSMGVAPPMRNTLSNANAQRPSGMARDLYWKMFSHLTGIAPKFGAGPHRGYCFRIKAPMFAVDSSTIKLTMNSFDWARHRRSKAAAKLHLTFGLGNRLPSFAIVEDAAHHDSVRAAELTAHLKRGDIAVADRAYTDCGFMNGLDGRGVRFVTRQKRNMKMTVVRELRTPAAATSERKTQILADEIVVPAKGATAAKYKGTLRRVTAVVEIQGQMKGMMFLTNNLKWSARTVAEIYRDRWGIETFFKELKQTCQIHDFIGYGENAVQWQVWTGLLAHLILRYLAYLSKWGLSFSRLAGVIRGTLWIRRKLIETLCLYGTAGPAKTHDDRPKRLYFQAVLEFGSSAMGQQTCWKRGFHRSSRHRVEKPISSRE